MKVLSEKTSATEELEDFSIMTVNSYGDKFWKDKDGNLHREDGPAVEFTNGSKFWYQHDKRHREDGPAVEYFNGAKSWYQHGKRHREDGPAVEFVDGKKYWYLNDKLVSEAEVKALSEKTLSSEELEDFCVMTINIRGDKIWRDKNRHLHREDGPAYEYASGSKYWFQHGLCHREDGPAIEDINGNKFWYINGKLVSEAEVKALGKMK